MLPFQGESYGRQDRGHVRIHQNNNSKLKKRQRQSEVIEFDFDKVPEKPNLSEDLHSSQRGKYLPILPTKKIKKRRKDNLTSTSTSAARLFTTNLLPKSWHLRTKCVQT